MHKDGVMREDRSAYARYDLALRKRLRNQAVYDTSTLDKRCDKFPSVPMCKQVDWPSAVLTVAGRESELGPPLVCLHGCHMQMHLRLLACPAYDVAN